MAKRGRPAKTSAKSDIERIKDEVTPATSVEITPAKEEKQYITPKNLKGIFTMMKQASGNKLASVVSEGTVGDVTDYTHTGCYLLNAQISGTLFGGVPNSQLLTLAGKSTTGKTFFMISIIDNFLKANPENGIVIIFDSENALNKNRLQSRGIDIGRIQHYPIDNLSAFQTQAIKILDKFNEEVKVGDVKLFFVLDSIGNLASMKELEDAKGGTDKQDFTRTKKIRSIFRTIIPKLTKHHIPFVVTNHTYVNAMAYGAPNVMAGGGGIEFGSDYILMLSKAKDKDAAGDVKGAFITSMAQKNRDAKENTKIRMMLSYQHGLHPYFGLIPYAVKAGVLSEVGGKKEEEPADGDDGKKRKKKSEYKFNGKVLKGDIAVYQMASEIFTKENLQKMDPFIKQDFCYGADADTAQAFGAIAESDEGEEDASQD